MSHNVGGPAEIINHGETGILFPPGDAAALARAILQLVLDPQLRARLGASGTKQVRDNWLWDKVVLKMQALYGEITAAPIN